MFCSAHTYIIYRYRKYKLLSKASTTSTANGVIMF